MNVQQFFYYLGIGCALAMDAFAITVANCAVYKSSLSKEKEWSMPIAFALFQIIMPIIGFYLGSLFAGFLAPASGYITAGVFLLLSGKILFDIVYERKKEKHSDGETPKKPENFSFVLLLIQAVATSIDALLIGFTFACSGLADPFIPCIIIGATTFIIVSVALFIGKSLGKLLGKYAIVFGACILFALFVYNLVKAVLGV